MAELKPCPFCGEKHNIYYFTKIVMFERNKWHIVRCLRCGTQVIRSSKESASEEWNKGAVK